MSTLDPFLLEVIACPVCKGPLNQQPDRLVCAACALGFPVIDGIPVLLLDDALPEEPA
jgi:uncharacterized protein YbaR (Trm112 family)